MESKWREEFLRINMGDRENYIAHKLDNFNDKWGETNLSTNRFILVLGGHFFWFINLFLEGWLMNLLPNGLFSELGLLFVLMRLAMSAHPQFRANFGAQLDLAPFALKSLQFMGSIVFSISPTGCEKKNSFVCC